MICFLPYIFFRWVHFNPDEGRNLLLLFPNLPKLGLKAMPCFYLGTNHRGFCRLGFSIQSIYLFDSWDQYTQPMARYILKTAAASRLWSGDETSRPFSWLDSAVFHVAISLLYLCVWLKTWLVPEESKEDWLLKKERNPRRPGCRR